MRDIKNMVILRLIFIENGINFNYISGGLAPSMMA